MILHGIERFLYGTMRLYFNWWIILAHTQNEHIITFTQEAYTNLEHGFYRFDRWHDDNWTARANDISDRWSSAPRGPFCYSRSHLIAWLIECYIEL